LKPFFRKLHRWLGLLMAVQILAWMASGLYFSIFPIGVIRGEHLVRAPEALTAVDLEGAISLADAWRAAAAEVPAPQEFGDIELVRRGGEAWYRVSGESEGRAFRRMVNAKSGEVAQALDAESVKALATTVLNAPGIGATIEWIERVPEGSEIRGRQLPLWRVSYTDPESVSLYFDPWTGDLLATRTTRWRVFDFLWMLHIMDFDERDDFNTPLLQVAAGLSLLVVISGVVFWAMTSRLFRRRRIRPQAAA
jgi:uncharacterized iron-regulated membrane protein